MTNLTNLTSFGQRRTARSYSEMVKAAVPIAYYRLGEASGITAVDEMGSYNGTYTPNSAGSWTGGTLGQTGAIFNDSNKVALFNGTTGYVTVPNAAGLQINGDLTVGLWAKLTSNGAYSGLVSKGVSNEFEIAADFTVGQNNRLAWRGGSSLNYSNYFTGFTGVWVYVVATITGTTLRVYRNGTIFGTNTIAARSAGTNPLQIGCRSPSTLFASGTLDEVEIYNRALSASEILTRYSRGIAG